MVNTILTQQCPKAKDLSLKAKEMPYCPQGASRPRTCPQGLQLCLAQSVPVVDFPYWSCKSRVSVLVLDIKVLVLVLVLKLLSLGLGLGLEPQSLGLGLGLGEASLESKSGICYTIQHCALAAFMYFTLLTDRCIYRRTK